MIEHIPPPTTTRPDTVWTVRAPGRVNIIGEHIDYNDGWVLPMAIEREVIIRATPRDDGVAKFMSTALGDTVAFELPGPFTGDYPHWARYLQGALAVFTRESGCTLPGFDARIESTIPQGAGLSSSAALEVAAMTLLETITGHPVSPVRKALLCREVEHEFAGMPCGIMDQMAAVLAEAGHLLLIDCATHETRSVALSNPDLMVLIANTGVAHALAESGYADRRSDANDALRLLGSSSYRNVDHAMLEAARDALGERLYRRARHVVTEIARTRTAVAALEARDWEALGKAMYASHASLADDYEVSCPELDCLVQAAADIGPAGGVVGARMTGGGFGGCTVTLVWRKQAEAVEKALRTRFAKAFGHEPDCFISRPAQGSG